MKKCCSLLLGLLLGISFSLTAQVRINEYSASNLNSFTDFFGKTEDWIELYNTSDVDMDISGWHLSDKEGKPEKWEIPAGTTISANGFLVFWCSGRDMEVDGEYHTNFKLSQTKNNEFVLLSSPNGSIVDIFALELTLVEHSHCRNMDGSNSWMICTEPSPGASNDGTTQYLGYTQTPDMSLEGGFYDDTLTVTILNNEPNSILRYTTDGTNPSESSPEYIDSLIIDATQVVKALSFSNDTLVLPGKMDFNTYFINEDFSLAVFSVAADSVIDLAHGNGELIPIGSLEYFNLKNEREATAFGSLNRHGQDSWVLPHRSLDWVSRDEMGYSKAVQAPLFGYSERDEYQKFMFRNSGDDNYPAVDDSSHEGSTHIRDEYVQTLAMEGGMKLDCRAVERVILFLNGEYWGVYGMRERPVDHDYTDEYYDQGKYDIQYLTTWGSTEIQYGGQEALQDWTNLRDFILQNDMSDPANYQVAEDSINLLSLIDYMVVNLSVVASDWLNYNTGWWRGRDPDGDHKKWGYILWDLDATFDYYINYSGVPNINPDADPCDLEDISYYMDEFFDEVVDTLPPPAQCESILNSSSPYPPDDTIFIQTINQYHYCCNEEWDDFCQIVYDNIAAGVDTLTPAEQCETIINGTAPYPPDDTIFIQTITQDEYCCDEGWDDVCQDLYENIAAGNVGVDTEGNVGKHEKIFLKLLEESPDFKQLYYSRYADMMNTVYSCDNMITTLDSMVAVIEPEMPRQIERWGGSMDEWKTNIQELKDFIEQRCTLLDDGIVGCYEELSGPFELTLLTQPDGVGEIDINTLDIESFPWHGYYFGGMENKIKAKAHDEFEDQYEFSHWISTSGNEILPDNSERKASIIFTEPDTLIAVFDAITSNNELVSDHSFKVFPNPAKDYLILKYHLEEATNVNVSLYSVLGQKIMEFPLANGYHSGGEHTSRLSLDRESIPDGLYILVVRIEDNPWTYKVNLFR